MMQESASGAPEAGPSRQQLPHLAQGISSDFVRPPFRPFESLPTDRPFFNSPTATYIPTFSHPVHFSLKSFHSALKDLAIHPERNSSLILRADPLPPKEANDPEMDLAGLERVETVRVRLMPKQVKRDGRLDQRVTFYEDDQGRGVVLLCPEVERADDVPFYHPPVRKLAVVYEPLVAQRPRETVNGQDKEDGEGDPYPIKATLSILYLPFETPLDIGPGKSTGMETTAGDEHPEESSHPMNPSFLGARPVRSPRKRSPLANTPLGQDEEQTKPPATVLNHDEEPVRPKKAADHAAITLRTVRTCRMILERVYKHAYGNMVGYTKRVQHDVVVNRESFQDLYLVLKERHCHLDSRVTKAHRVEDVKRHVWKLSETSLPSDPSLPTADVSHYGMQDVAIATFLMLLWREMYPAQDTTGQEEEAPREWDTWGRPPGGFVDLGCGNGLLVHILTAEGYKGKGYELRARKTWPNYPPATRQALVEYPIAFPEWFPDSVNQWMSGDWEGKADCPIKDDVFIIGNHADEITPWIPFLSLIPRQPVPFLSLPCCLHTLDNAFTIHSYDPPSHPHTPTGGFGEGLGEGESRYKAYLMWLGYNGLKCGWRWEKEGLRIPSTKGWAIVARNRWPEGVDDERKCREWAMEQVEEVRRRGIFKVREKEGKDTH